MRGVVQGVGFRPGMWRLARSLELVGLVRNDGDAVWIEVEGPPEGVSRFVTELPRAAPSQARVEEIAVMPMEARGGTDFEIVASGAQEGEGRASIPPDLAPCADCLRELADPADRRHRYVFINCTSCGPRYTIVRSLPYDRASTTMEAFPLCDACRREYEDPWDRRFHAEPVACPVCGPRLAWRAGGRVVAEGEDALGCAVSAIAGGDIVAVKGVGGYLLAVDAANEAAVARLRRRKGRPRKPFAVMARSVEEAERVAIVSEEARALLVGPERPIVLLPVRSGASGVAEEVAPGLRELGVFLPPSPLQHLLVTDGPPLQVMTSGNASDEPIATTDGEALERLSGIADAFLSHDRPIEARADDSVVRPTRAGPVILRCARGFVPRAIGVPAEGPPVLAVGGEWKGTICLAAGGRAVLSPHLGDVAGPAGARAFEQAVAHLVRLLGVEPAVVAHDLHPDYATTRWAMRHALEAGIRRVPVQHHHAHVAACMAEHGRAGPAIGVAFDGTGYGDDATLWGGEILAVDLRSVWRVGHLRPIALPGGEAAIRQPWRLAAAALLDAGEDLDLLARIDAHLLSGVKTIWERRLATPPSTGAGRWFDAVAALCGVCDEASYEGQAAIELEARAEGAADTYEVDVVQPTDAPFQLDLRPTIRAIAADLRAGAQIGRVAAGFHEAMARAVLAGCRVARAEVPAGPVVLTGGCFQNARLLERAVELLERDGFEVLSHRLVPPNDGGISLGQAVVAAARLAQEG